MRAFETRELLAAPTVISFVTPKIIDLHLNTLVAKKKVTIPVETFMILVKSSQWQRHPGKRMKVVITPPFRNTALLQRAL